MLEEIVPTANVFGSKGITVNPNIKETGTRDIFSSSDCVAQLSKSISY